MKRSDVINHAARQMGYRRYLEIGVQEGVTFNDVRIARKTAVDPMFGVGVASLSGTAFKMTSDAYFDAHTDAQFDLVFIDGLHTFEQSLRDFTRSIHRLRRNGLILLDDCVPSDYYASLRSMEDCNRAKIAEGRPDRDWMGDVYKTLIFINDFLDQFSYAVLKDTLGIAAAWHAPRKVKPFFDTVAALAACDYFTFKHTVLPAMPRLTIDEVVQAMRKGQTSAAG